MIGEINSLMVIPISFARSIRIDLPQNPMSKEMTRMPKNKWVKREKKTLQICCCENPSSRRLREYSADLEITSR